MRYILFSLIIINIAISCSTESASSQFQVLDLLKYNIPISILAPDSAEVQTMDLVVQKDVSIRAGDDFYVQLFMSDATEIDSKKVLSKLKTEVQSSDYFSKFILEEENGFIFENAFDSTNVNYDFRYVKIQGDNEFEFRTGLIGSFSLPQVELMYEAVQGKK